jgi:15-cis-phytoene synthase
MQHRNVLHKGGLRAARNGRAAYRRVLGSETEIRGGRIVVAETLTASEQYCQEITRREARNFYWGFVALPKRQRVAIYALYSFSRQVDDAIDLGGHDFSSNGKATTALEQCAIQRRRVEDCYRGKPGDPVTRVLCDVVREYEIPREELLALVRGVEMDIEHPRYETWEDLEQYCHHVASAVGRMCVRIFGYSDAAALTYADDLGTALQITNILRDVREDFDLGRVYLPQEELRGFGVAESSLGTAQPRGKWEDMVRLEIERAKGYYDSGLRVTELIPRRAAACVLTMAGLYRKILNQIEEDPYLPLRQRAHLRKRTKLKVLLGSWLKAV